MTSYYVGNRMKRPVVGTPKPIHASKYSTFLSTFVFPEDDSMEEVRITRSMLHDGQITTSYDPNTCKMFQGRMVGSMPIVTLRDGDHLWMSDTPMEQESMRPVLRRARGNVLICGLGLGMVPLTLLSVNKRVSYITIVENNLEIVDLVWPKVRGDKVRLYVGDCFDIARDVGGRYDYIYVDIWPEILGPIREAERIHEVFDPLLREGGRCDVWLQDMYDAIGDKLPKRPMQLPGFFGSYPPCLVCGKTLRYDYAGICMDCADTLGVSELYVKVEKREDELLHKG